MIYKALKNFTCNSVRKTEGQIVDAEEAHIMGNFAHQLVIDGVLEAITVDPKPSVEPVAKQKRKRGPRKKV
jgi:hypothetical protein